MSNTFPFEVIAAPFTVYVAPLGTAFPDLAVDPLTISGWVKIGSSGALNYDDGAGVTVGHPQSIVKWRALGSAGVRKVFRTEEDLQVKLKLVDITLEQYRYALNSNSVTDTPGATPLTGNRKIGLSRGLSVATMALLIKGEVSPYGDNAAAPWSSQYEVPYACQGGSPEIQYVKSTPAGLELMWDAIVDPNAASADEEYGRLVVQDADAS